MIQTINPYATARTAEIMSRYRPIAPKPESPATGSAAENDSSAVPSGIRKSPYLRNVWAHLQARPTRTRKRGRAAAFSPPSVKRARTCLQGLASPYQGVITGSPAKNLAMHGFSHAAAAAANGQMGQFSLVPLNCGPRHRRHNPGGVGGDAARMPRPPPWYCYQQGEREGDRFESRP
ncbi:hypothetical protein MIMGU_mgv1a014853mg [Erythranthe guttata]|uniref:Uncharacterized protein n=1 Tax=Erythranthe guttata TaxID=4155 RepID=A0A022R8S0_ERYGU|nr:hypothetical protein MIMGU_mgv1a014853mg [Erythranthe guttata]